MIGRMPSKEFMDSIYGRSPEAQARQEGRRAAEIMEAGEYGSRLEKSLQGTWPPKRSADEEESYQERLAAARKRRWDSCYLSGLMGVPSPSLYYLTFSSIYDDDKY